MISIKDFEVGKKAFLFINKTGNVGRYIKSNNIEDYIKEITVIKVGRKNVYVDYLGMSFSQTDYAVGLVQNTNLCVDYFLFPDKTSIIENEERKRLIDELRKYFFTTQGIKQNLTLEKIKKILEIIEK